MAARKRTSSKTPAPSVDAASLIVVLEDMRSQFTVFGEALQSSREESKRRFEQQDARFASLERDVREVRHDLVEIRGTVHRIESALVSKVNRDEVESIVHRVLGRP